MRSPVVTVTEQTPLSVVCDVLVEQRLGGVPVVDEEGRVIGIITSQDVFFGAVGRFAEDLSDDVAPTSSEEPCARDVMTSPAICASEDTDVTDLARLMWTLRLHRVPIVAGGRLAGIVSAMDLCRVISVEGLIPVA